MDFLKGLWDWVKIVVDVWTRIWPVSLPVVIGMEWSDHPVFREEIKIKQPDIVIEKIKSIESHLESINKSVKDHVTEEQLKLRLDSIEDAMYRCTDRHPSWKSKLDSTPPN